MTAEEAATIQRIANDVDDGCCVCARYVTLDLIKAFPEHRQVFINDYVARFGDDPTEEADG